MWFRTQWHRIDVNYKYSQTQPTYDAFSLEYIAMSKQPEFKKYLPLEEWFRTRPARLKRIELTFDQVEAILSGSSFAQIRDQVGNLVDECPAKDSKPSHGLAE